MPVYSFKDSTVRLFRPVVNGLSENVLLASVFVLM